MPNQSGNIYGLTILSPIINGADGDVSHDCAIRDYLANLPRDHRSLFAKVSSTHLARLVVMDDVVFVGTPAREIQAAFREFLNKVHHAREPLAGEYEGHLHAPATGAGAVVRTQPLADEHEGQAHG